jgi:hypothetical protein
MVGIDQKPQHAKGFLPSADYKVVAEGLEITFIPTPPKTLLKSVTKTPSLTHLMTSVT